MPAASPTSAKWQEVIERALAVLGQDRYISEEARRWFLAHPRWLDDVERDA